MDFVNQSIAQVTELLRSMTPSARLIAVLMLVAIGISLTYLLRVQTSTGDEYLFGGQAFNMRELANMDLAFSKAGLSGSRIEGLRMLVPRGQKDVYLKAIQENDSMPDLLTSFTDRAIGKDSPWTSREQRSRNFKNATEKELSQIIRKMRDIDEAQVVYDESEGGGLHRVRERTALAAVRAKGNRALGEDEVNAIREAIRGSLTGLKPGNISVLDMNSGITHTCPDPNRPQGGENNIYLTSMRLYERSYKSKILERLVPMYPGIAVGVSVELDPELYQTTYSTDFKGKPVAVDRKTLEKETPMAMASNGGRPGTFPNAIGNSSQQVASATTTERATETRTEERLINSQQRLESQKAGLVPKTVKASIDVPMSYLSKVWREANPKADKDTAPADDDLKKLESDARKRIEAAMVGVLPQTKGADGSSLVSISFSPDLTPEPLAQPSMTETATSWLAGNWQSIGMLGLGLVALLFLKGLAKPTPVDTEPGATATRDESASAPGPQLRVVSASEDAAAEAAKTARQKRSFRGTGPNLRAELTELVKEDPETAANILRNWIGDVA